jgi:sugar/nucleoside kinase (ribokinase family)
MKKVIGLGNALVDIMIMLDDDKFLEENNLPKGSMQLVDIDVSNKIDKTSENFEKKLTSGGSAANTIQGIAKLGIESSYIGKVSNDNFGDFFEKKLREHNINPVLLKTETATGRAMALVTKDGERTFATYLGAAVELSADELKEEMFDSYNFFHIEGYLVYNHDLMLKSAKLAKSKGLKISLDLASYNVVEDNFDFLKSYINEYVDIIFANEEEAKAFTNKEPKEALNDFAEICEIAVVKVGSKGSYIKKNDSIIKIGVIDANLVDTTGAGDLYAAGFLYGLANDYDLEKSGNIGAILSGKVIEVIGAQMNDDVWTEIKSQIANL